MVVQDAQGAKISDVCKAVGAAMDEYSLEAHVGVLVRGAREAEDTGDQGVKGHASTLRPGSCPQRGLAHRIKSILEVNVYSDYPLP